MQPERVAAEARALAAFHRIDAEDVVGAIEPCFAGYAEVVLRERGLELICGGRGEECAAQLASLASELGASRRACGAFLDLADALDGRSLGLKVALGPKSGRPSLYVRTMLGIEEGLRAALHALPQIGPAIDELRACHAGTRILYGIGIEGSGLLKTYAISEIDHGVDGFVSYRVEGSRVVRDPKRYRPNVAWPDIAAPTKRWARVLAFASELGYERAGHVGLWESGVERMKVYVERIGAIPTDYAAR